MAGHIIIPDEATLREIATGKARRSPRGSVAFNHPSFEAMYSRTSGLPSGSSYTMMCWAYVPAGVTAGWSNITHFGDTSNMETGIAWPGNGTSLRLLPGSVPLVDPMPLDKWMHVAIVANNSFSNRSGYYNGENVTTDNNDASGTYNVLSLGNSAWFVGQNWPGWISDFRVWDVPLTASEIRREMRYPVPYRWRNLNSWYPIVDRSTGHLDYGLYERHFTVGDFANVAKYKTSPGPPMPLAQMRRLGGFVSAPPGGGGPAVSGRILSSWRSRRM